MGNRTAIESAVGVFVLIGLLCVGYLTIKLGKMELLGDNFYYLQARFQNATGVKKGAQVEIAGVPVGQVDSITLDRQKQMALIKMKIQKGIQVTDDVIASVKTSGLIGDRFIKLSPGGSDKILKSGDTITETESAIDIEALVSKYVFGGVK
ncbi:outer membrane lipid asymmetry maintenance protein MlaD [Desulfatirhabdium butyrativorans]|uniref:outer membrane lipid asymmetry maintenance protein MlaD n=1 Tax=Desulfatirhabdium butyrativorans TaxID=340467 RepID=UPI00041696BC|nr:outer membrane lipid asymmetry maintenance protein MlaD [Desulfatirhabdium butyrativorans]